MKLIFAVFFPQHLHPLDMLPDGAHGETSSSSESASASHSRLHSKMVGAAGAASSAEDPEAWNIAGDGKFEQVVSDILGYPIEIYIFTTHYKVP